MKQVRALERSQWLDVLRGLAIIGVVSVHSIQITDHLVLYNKSNVFSYFLGLGKYGVELFFFLSGWLLVSIYGLNREPLSKVYILRRICRIYPLWILFLLINIFRLQFNSLRDLESPFDSSSGNPSFLHSPVGMLLLGATFTLFVSASLWNTVIPGGWSIQAEVAHYILFPLIRRRSLNQVLKSLTLINCLTLGVDYFRAKIESFPKLILCILDAWLRLGLYSTIGYFLIGILSYKVFSGSIKAWRDASFLTLKVSYSTAIFFALSLLVIPCPFGNQIEAILFLVTMILISLAILRIKLLNKFFQFLGRYSYFIYFMHIPILGLLYLVLKGEILSLQSSPQFIVFTLVLFFALTFSSLLAVPSMKYFELPFMRLAHRPKSL